MGDAELHRGQLVDGRGQGWICAKTEIPKPELNSILANMKKKMDAEAKHAIKSGEDGDHERDDYERDPHGHHGVKQSDFS